MKTPDLEQIRRLAKWEAYHECLSIIGTHTASASTPPWKETEREQEAHDIYCIIFELIQRLAKEIQENE